MSKTTLPHPSHTIPAGMKVCHRTYGVGRVLPAQARSGAPTLVEFDSGAVTAVESTDLVPLPPEGFAPQFDSDGNLMYYSGPVVGGKGVSVALDWSPQDGMLFWLSPKSEGRGDEDIFTTEQVRELVKVLQDLLDEA